jgi:hypothetical protein
VTSLREPAHTSASASNHGYCRSCPWSTTSPAGARASASASARMRKGSPRALVAESAANNANAAILPPLFGDMTLNREYIVCAAGAIRVRFLGENST